MSSRKHLSTRLIKSNSIISSKTTLQPSACYPEPSAVSRTCKTRGPPRERVEILCLPPRTCIPHPDSHWGSQRRRRLVAQEDHACHANTISKCRVSTRMPPTASLARQQQLAGPRFEQSRRLESSRCGRQDETTATPHHLHPTEPTSHRRAHLPGHTHTHSTGFPNAFTDNHLAKVEAKRQRKS